MERVLNLCKERGETPLECIERFARAHPEYRTVPMSYAGRLDPMAEGVLLVLVADENKRRKEYLSLAKAYRVDVLFGFATDTYDALGLLTHTISRATHKPLSPGVLLEHIARLAGTQVQAYPPFSSKPLGGVPLHALARAGKLAGKTLPVHEVCIDSATLLGMRRMSQETLWRELVQDITQVRGDFRQERILGLWEEQLRTLSGLSFDIATISISCSSGTYVRSIAHELGCAVGVPALAYRIMRTQVGKWTLDEVRRYVRE